MSTEAGERVAVPGWEEFEPSNAEEVVGLALIAAGVFGEESGVDDQWRVTMDRQTASEVVEGLRARGYLNDDPLAAAWKAVEAALPLGGWAAPDGRWVIPSEVWDINIRHFPASGDGHSEPYYPEQYEAVAEVQPNKRFVGTAADTPAAALRALTLALLQPPNPLEGRTPK